MCTHLSLGGEHLSYYLIDVCIAENVLEHVVYGSHSIHTLRFKICLDGVTEAIIVILIDLEGCLWERILK